MIKLSCKRKILITLLGGSVYALAQPGINANNGRPPLKEAWDFPGLCYNISYASCQESTLGNFLAPPCGVLVDWNSNFYAAACAGGASYGYSSTSSSSAHTCSTYISYTNPCTGKPSGRSIKWNGPGGVNTIKTPGCRGASCDNPG